MFVCLFVFVDTENPVILNIPSNLTEYTVDGEDTAVADWTEPSAVDNSGIHSLTSSHSPGSLFPVGSTSVRYTATDPTGNVVVEEFYVLVIQRKYTNCLELIGTAV